MASFSLPVVATNGSNVYVYGEPSPPPRQIASAPQQLPYSTSSPSISPTRLPNLGVSSSEPSATTPRQVELKELRKRVANYGTKKTTDPNPHDPAELPVSSSTQPKAKTQRKRSTTAKDKQSTMKATGKRKATEDLSEATRPTHRAKATTKPAVAVVAKPTADSAVISDEDAAARRDTPIFAQTGALLPGTPVFQTPDNSKVSIDNFVGGECCVCGDIVNPRNQPAHSNAHTERDAVCCSFDPNCCQKIFKDFQTASEHSCGDRQSPTLHKDHRTTSFASRARKESNVLLSQYHRSRQHVRPAFLCALFNNEARKASLAPSPEPIRSYNPNLFKSEHGTEAMPIVLDSPPPRKRPSWLVVSAPGTKSSTRLSLTSSNPEKTKRSRKRKATANASAAAVDEVDADVKNSRQEPQSSEDFEASFEDNWE